MNRRDSGITDYQNKLEKEAAALRAAANLNSSQIDFPVAATATRTDFCAFDARPAHKWRVKFTPAELKSDPPLANLTYNFSLDRYYFSSGYSTIDEQYTYADDDINPPDNSSKYFILYHNSETDAFAGNTITFDIEVRSNVSGTITVDKIV